MCVADLNFRFTEVLEESAANLGGDFTPRPSNVLEGM